jgi:hypothetical protein
MTSLRTRLLPAALGIAAVLAATAPAGGAGPTQGSAPNNTERPSIRGTAEEGQTLVGSAGTWTGTQPISYAVQFLRCNTAGASCVSVARASSYTLRAADVGHTIVFNVLATNSAGSGSANSAPTAVVRAGPQRAPNNTVRPSIRGTAREGQTLVGSSGTWTGTQPISYAVQFLRCNTAGASCTSVARASSYTLRAADVGRTIVFNVLATNSAGSGSANSARTAVVRAAAPRNTAPPVIRGTARDGQTLTVTTGTWTGVAPITYSYQWYRCTPTLSGCQAISGATRSTYTLTTADVGSRALVNVQARNSGGSTIAQAASAVIAARGTAPASTGAPTIAGTATVGGTLTASNGGWTGTTPISYTYQWQRCASNGSSCAAIAGATAQTYRPVAADLGRTLRIVVTAANAVGSTAATSAATGVVTPAGPAGQIRLPNGRISIPVTSVALPARLVISRVSFSPNPVRSRSRAVTVRVTVTDTRGYAVRGALVFLRSTPLLSSTPPESATGNDGTVVLQTRPGRRFPLAAGRNVQFFVRARKPGDNVLAGVSTRRLVQVRTAAPR